MANLKWDKSTLTEHKQQRIEALLVEDHTFFGTNADFKIKLTSKHDDPAYLQSLLTPSNLKDDLLVELFFMQEYGIISILSYSKSSSLIFAQRTPNRKLRILVELRRINHLLKNNSSYHNHLVTTIAETVQHMAAKKYFCEVDCSCSQTYYCLQMAHEQSIQRLVLNFAFMDFCLSPACSRVE